MSLNLLLLSCLFYTAAFIVHALNFSSIQEDKRRIAFVFMRIAFLLATLFFASEVIIHQLPVPVFAFSQALTFFAWSLAFVYLVLLVRVQNESFGLVLNPILMILTFTAWVTACLTTPDLSREIPQALVNPYFIIHIVCAFFAYASFTLSFAAGVLYMIQSRQLKSKRGGAIYQKLPSLEESERLISQPLLWGAPLLLVAAAVGMVWSKSAFGSFWILDPKTISTAVISLIYLIILILRFSSLLRGRQVALVSMIAFSLVIVSFVGTRFIHGSHNYLQ